MNEKTAEQATGVSGVKTYWDLTPEVRRVLNETDLDEYKRIELMRHGIVVPLHPVKPPDAPTVVGRTVYTIEHGHHTWRQSLDISFMCENDAHHFLELEPQLIDTNYDYGSLRYTKPLTEARVVSVNIPHEEQVGRYADALKETADAERRYKALLVEYNAAKKKADEVLSRIENDRKELVEEEERRLEILAKYDEYLALCGGNKDAATHFLREVYGDECDAALGVAPQVESA